MQPILSENECTVIEIPSYLSVWDVDKVTSQAFRKITTPEVPCVIDMKNVKNVFNSTVRLLLRIYDRATRLSCPVCIINASEPVCNALVSLQIDQKIPLTQEYELAS